MEWNFYMAWPSCYLLQKSFEKDDWYSHWFSIIFFCFLFFACFHSLHRRPGLLWISCRLSNGPTFPYCMQTMATARKASGQFKPTYKSLQAIASLSHEQLNIPLTKETIMWVFLHWCINSIIHVLTLYEVKIYHTTARKNSCQSHWPSFFFFSMLATHTEILPFYSVQLDML